MRLDLSLPIEIRPVREGDLDDLEWDSEQAIQAGYVRQTLAERSREVVFLLAVANGRPVGRLGIDFERKAEEGIVHLWAFSVLPALQRLGIGTALMREAEMLVAAAPRDATLVEVGVDEWNHEAAKLYRRLGYTDAGSELDSNGDVVVLFRRPIIDIGDEGGG